MAATREPDSSFSAYGELTKQVLTLSTAVLALTITFLTDVVKHVSGVERWLLGLSWLFYVLSMVFGVFVLMALSGALHCIEHPGDTHCKGLTTPITIYSSNIRVTSWLQVVSFFVASVLLLAFGSLEV